MDQLKIGAIFITKEEIEEADRMFHRELQQIAQAYEKRDINGLSHLIYTQFIKHFSAVFLIREDTCLKKVFDEMMVEIKRDITHTMNMMRGGAIGESNPN